MLGLLVVVNFRAKNVIFGNIPSPVIERGLLGDVAILNCEFGMHIKVFKFLSRRFIQITNSLK